MVLDPDSAIPDGHERDAEEKAKDAAHLSNHGGGRVKKLLSLNQSVPATIVIQRWWTFQLEDLELAWREKFGCSDLKEVGRPSPSILYSI